MHMHIQRHDGFLMLQVFWYLRSIYFEKSTDIDFLNENKTQNYSKQTIEIYADI